jgi:hypothetical protein
VVTLELHRWRGGVVTSECTAGMRATGSGWDQLTADAMVLSRGTLKTSGITVIYIRFNGRSPSVTYAE